MSWLGNGFREESKALADAYAQMYAPKEEEQKEEEKVEQEELSEADKKKGRCWTGYKPTPGKKPYAPGSCQKEEQLLVAMKDAYEMMYEKKSGSDKCGDDTYWDKEEKKCKSKKSKKRSTVIVGGGRWGHGHDHDDDGENDTDSGAAGDAAGAAGGGGGGE